MAGFLINSRGMSIMIDPLLGGFDMPVMIEFPIAAHDVPNLDAVLVTHRDNHHYSVLTVVIWLGSPVRTTRPSTWLR